MNFHASALPEVPMKTLMLVLLAVASPFAWSAQPTTSAASTESAADTVAETAARQEMADLQKQLGALSQRMADRSGLHPIQAVEYSLCLVGLASAPQFAE